MDNSIKPDVVYAVVVTFNRKTLLVECLKALLLQTIPLSKIIVVDNSSTDGTYEYLKDTGLFKEKSISYISLPKNIGGAGGFSQGLSVALRNNPDWIWLMDDDAEPVNDALESLLNINPIREVVALAGTVITNNEIAHVHRGIVKPNIKRKMLQLPLHEDYYAAVHDIDFASFVGMLVRGTAAQAIGLPDARFFIHHDDVDYSLRLRSIGRIQLVPKSIIHHKEATAAATQVRSLFGLRSNRQKISHAWIGYCTHRNYVYVVRRYHPNKLFGHISILTSFLFNIGGTLLLDDYKLKRMAVLKKAYISGFLGRFSINEMERLRAELQDL